MSLLTKHFSDSKIKALNIIGAIVIAALNTGVNFFLSPYIVKYLGVEMNGYISLANNFISYANIAIMALNSMSGRFILISLKQENTQEANEYYSSVWIGDIIIALFIIVPSIVFIMRIDKFLTVAADFLIPVKILFTIIFLNFFITLCTPNWRTITYVKNKLYLRSLKNLISTISRVGTILLLFSLFKPAAYYVAIASMVMTITNTLFEFYYKKELAPELHTSFRAFKWKKVRNLISSGIWNSFSMCGNLLLEGLDLLIANLFINPTAMGVLSISKTIPNMLNQVLGNISTTFGPQLANSYAKSNFDLMEKEIKSNIRILSLITTIPIGITFFYGRSFFSLWVPSQNSDLLLMLSSLTLVGMLFSGITHAVTTVFGILNKLKLYSAIVIATGIANVTIVYILLKTTDIGVVAIAGVSSVISAVRDIVFTVPYAATCINKRFYVFFPDIFKGIGSVIIPILICMLLRLIVNPSNWASLIFSILVVSFLSIILYGILIFQKEERHKLIAFIRYRFLTSKK